MNTWARRVQLAAAVNLAIWFGGPLAWILLSLIGSALTHPAAFMQDSAPGIFRCLLGIILVLAAFTAPAWLFLMVSPLMQTNQQRVGRRDVARRFYRWLWSPVLTIERWRIRRRELRRIAGETPIRPDERAQRVAELRHKLWGALGFWGTVWLMMAATEVFNMYRFHESHESLRTVLGFSVVQIGLALLCGTIGIGRRAYALLAYHLEALPVS